MNTIESVAKAVAIFDKHNIPCNLITYDQFISYTHPFSTFRGDDSNAGSFSDKVLV
jgi:hypothetical protein